MDIFRGCNSPVLRLHPYDSWIWNMINIKIIIITALAIELLTIVVRFGFKISSKEVYIKIMKKFKFKKFYHIHHLIWGILLAVIFYSNPLLLNIGIGVILSDLIHHFVVLWTVVGSPEFHIVYKNVNCFNREEKMEKRKMQRFVRNIEKEEKLEERKIKRFLNHIVQEV
jgi:hypothetical protein